MSQEASQNQAVVSSPSTAEPPEAASTPNSWGRTVVLIGVALLVAGLFLGGLFKGSETGMWLTRVFGFAGTGCLAVGLLGVGFKAIQRCVRT